MLLIFLPEQIRPGSTNLSGRMSAPAQAVDITSWLLFAKQWNDTSFLRDLEVLKVDLSVLLDASGSWGCGTALRPPVAATQVTSQPTPAVHSSEEASSGGTCGHVLWQNLVRQKI